MVTKAKGIYFFALDYLNLSCFCVFWGKHEECFSVYIGRIRAITLVPTSLFSKRITNVSFRMALSFWKLVLLNADAKSTLQLIWLVVNHPQNLDWKFIDNFYVITRWTPGPSPGSIKESPGTICWIDWCVFEENICWF